MAIVIKRQPNEFDFTGNDIYFRLSGSAYANDVATSSVTTLARRRMVSGISNPELTAGQKIRFSFLDLEVEILFVSDPDDSGCQVFPGTGTHIITELKRNYLLGRYYTITGNDAYLIFTSKDKPGAPISVDLTDCPAYGLLSNVQGNDYHIRNKQYRVYSALFLGSGVDSFELKNEMFTDVNSLGETTVLVSGLLRKMMDIHAVPSIYENIPRVAYTAKRYHVQFAEYYDSVIRRLTVSATRYAVPGKIPVLSHKLFNYSGWIRTHKCFLTNVKSPVFTTYRAEQYLYFLSEKERNNLFVVADVAYTTGEMETREIFAISRMGKGEIMCIPAGIMHCGIHRDDKIIKSYGITLRARVNILASASGNEEVLAAASYEVGREPSDVAYFTYMNELGVYETLIAGKPNAQTTTKRTEVEKFELDGYNRENNLDDSSTIYEAVTIPLTKAEQHHLNEFLDSDHVYLRQGRRRYKVSLEPSTTETVNPKIQIQSVKFKYKLDIAGDVIYEERNYDEPDSRMATIDSISTAANLNLGLRYPESASKSASGTVASTVPNLNTIKLAGLKEPGQQNNINHTDSVLSAFGKIKKVLSSLKLLAYKDRINWNTDIDDVPQAFPPSAHFHPNYQAISEKDVAGGYPGIDPDSGKISTEWLPQTSINKEKRFLNVDGTCYCGTAPPGAAEGELVWMLTKIVVARNGTAAVTRAVDSWNNVLMANYQ